MHVLIADDDRITLEGLQQYVDWDGLGLEVTACARDGREALEVLSNTDIDILITAENIVAADKVENIYKF